MVTAVDGASSHELNLGDLVIAADDTPLTDVSMAHFSERLRGARSPWPTAVSACSTAHLSERLRGPCLRGARMTHLSERLERSAQPRPSRPSRAADPPPPPLFADRFLWGPLQ